MTLTAVRKILRDNIEGISNGALCKLGLSQSRLHLRHAILQDLRDWLLRLLSQPCLASTHLTKARVEQAVRELELGSTSSSTTVIPKTKVNRLVLELAQEVRNWGPDPSIDKDAYRALHQVLEAYLRRRLA